MRVVLSVRDHGIRAQALVFLALMLLLLGLGLEWRVPMMLWDHLDLIPMLEAWHAGRLGPSGFIQIHHGSHLHAPAYAVLLLTTTLSHGKTWLDVLVSGLLLFGWGGLAWRWARQGLRDGAAPWLPWLTLAWALYPGHLANLQWGWQVAVFLCLLGMGGAVTCLTTLRARGRYNVLALLAAGLAATSFSIGWVMVPVAWVLIALRQDLSLPRRLAWMLPWCLIGALAASHLSPGGVGISLGRILGIAHYALNFLGAGIARFATDLAAPMAALALISSVMMVWPLRHGAAVRPWGALLLIGMGSAVLTALGREADFGPAQAFASRYVSFSSVFWMGWFGVLALSWTRLGQTVRHGVAVLAWLALALACFNALHLIKQARDVGTRSQATTMMIRAQYPDVDEAVLRSIYFERADESRERLAVLHRLGYAPFGQ